ncbi:MAG: sulfotransferase family protein [Alphaproteobacteria bacterium]|nr:MAG: sulfotransferase family protein [Alphaproteobacteria bacterium]
MSKILERAARRLERDSTLIAKRAVQALRPARRGRDGKTVLFVSGVQRSGTEMMMQVLERSFETDMFHESDARAFADYQMRERAVIHRLVDESRAPVVVIKALCEAQELRSLLDEFAPAKALWAVRRYEDMINSHLRKWTGCPQTIGDIVADRNAAAWRGRGMSDETHALVSRYYHPDMTPASAVALFWVFRNRLFFEQGFDTDERVLVVRYEPLVRDPIAGFGRIFEFAGLKFSPRFVHDVHAGSIGKQRPPDIEPAIRELCDEMIARYDAVAGT